MKNLHVLVHPDLSFEDIVAKCERCAMGDHDVVLLNYGEKNDALFNWYDYGQSNVLEFHYVDNVDGVFEQIAHEFSDRYDKVLLDRADHHADLHEALVEDAVEELVEKYDDNDDGQLSAEELKDVVEDIVVNLVTEEGGEFVENVVEDHHDEFSAEEANEENTTEDNVSDSSDSDDRPVDGLWDNQSS